MMHLILEFECGSWCGNSKPLWLCDGFCAQQIEACYSPIVAEATAVLREIILAVKTGLVPFVVETDALGVVNLVKAGCSFSNDIGLVINDILAHLREAPGVSLNFVPRKANYVAHSLAKLALESSELRFWMEECPPCVERYVRNYFHV
ncbi:hypothetical protein Dsin_021637 [Dipteronia sinensis]|uniref:RNase H type-1 domain-containing protein n=1 Tax=Dipteronia sinensis TaxID=43782 RepID=A0AAE0E0F0_9ROSI|nr:hypothetical protein Dsin_021637 [Dipteronia sinensis]